MKIAYSEEILEEAPARVARFLQGVAAVPTVRTLLAQAGMGQADLEEGRSLLLQALAIPLPMAPDLDTDEARRQRAAVAELDAWDEPNFARFGAALRRRNPSVHGYLFNDLKSARGADSVRVVATFLARVEALATGSDGARAFSRDDDLRGVELLAARGLHAAERQRLQQLVELALGPTSPLPDRPALDDAERLRALGELKAWHDEWATTARAVVKRRADLIRLGLASRARPAPNAAVATGAAVAE